MGFKERLSHLFSFALRTFPQEVEYLAVGESTPTTFDAIELISTTEEISSTSSSTSKLKTRLLVSVEDIEGPQYRDKITFSDQSWYVERFIKSQDVDYWELTLRRDEKLIYG